MLCLTFCLVVAVLIVLSFEKLGECGSLFTQFTFSSMYHYISTTLLIDT